jgi:hypothetical protein
LNDTLCTCKVNETLVWLLAPVATRVWAPAESVAS